MSISTEEMNRIISHMNEDHEASLILYAAYYADRTDIDSAKMTDLTENTLVLELESGESLEIPLIESVHSAKDAHRVLVEMHKQASV